MRKLLALLVLMTCGTASAQSVVSVPSALEHFLGTQVNDFTGQPRAKVEDLVLDLANAHVRYAILEAGGRRIAYPFARLEVSIDGKRLLTHDSAERLARAPALEDRDGSPFWKAYWAGSEIPRLAAATDLLGRAVSAPDGTGQLADIAIDAADGSVAFAVVRLLMNRLHAIPLRALALEGGKLVFRIPFSSLDPSRDITPAELADLRDQPVLARRLAAYAESLSP